MEIFFAIGLVVLFVLAGRRATTLAKRGVGRRPTNYFDGEVGGAVGSAIGGDFGGCDSGGGDGGGGC